MYQRSLIQVTKPLPNKRLSSSQRSRNACLLYSRRPWKLIMARHQSGLILMTRMRKSYLRNYQPMPLLSRHPLTILYYITSARLGDVSWKNWMHTFILHWQEQVRMYEALYQLGSFLLGSIGDHIAKCSPQYIWTTSIKKQVIQHNTKSGIDLTYLQYCNLLLSAATE